MRRAGIHVSVFLVIGMSAVAQAEISALPSIPLTIATHELFAEVAHTQQARAQGLMFRPMLPENVGMLFVFPHSTYYGMWMKNTMIPLSVAFIDEKGVILNIANMEPYTLTAHYSAGPVKYALEVNRGWFAHKKIQPGAYVSGLEYAPAAE